jgi:hypothetical protein
MQVIVHKEKMDVGEGAHGPRSMEFFTIALPRVVVTQQDGGPLLFLETPEQEGKVLVLPYVIWCPHEFGRVRFRWARRHASMAEKRIGITTHGMADDLHGAVVACLGNHLERARVTENEA